MSIKLGKSIQRGQYPFRLKGSDKCANHIKDEVVFLCKDCNTLVCIKCSTTTHKSHSLLNITKIAKEQKNKLHEIVNNTDDVKIPKIKEKLRSAKIELSTYQLKYKNLSDFIKEQRDQCKLELDKITEDYVRICDQMEEASTNLLRNYITNMEDRLNTLANISSECKQTLQTDNAIHVYDSVSEIEEMDYLDIIPQTPKVDVTLQFTPSKDRQSRLEQAMGEMKNTTEHHKAGQGSVAIATLSKSTERVQGTTRLRDSPTVISQFSYPDDITSICSTSDGGAWLCDFDSDKVHLINTKGLVIQTLKHGCDISHISLDPTTGRLWFSCVDERTVSEVSSSSKPIRRFTTDTYGDPYSLCVTREGRVVVGTRKSRQGYKLVEYTADGKVIRTTTVEGSGRGFIRSITQCGVTRNIAVVGTKLISGDGSDPDHYGRHIIVYDPTLQLMIHYRGGGIQSPKAIPSARFDPITVAYDSNGNIVIADQTRNTIELIGGGGKYIKTLHTNKARQGPVDIQKDDVLWSYLELDTGEDGIKLIKY